MRRLTVFLLSIVLSTAPLAQENGYQVEQILADRNYPWSVAFMPSGDLLVTELPGNLLRVSPDGTVTNIANVPAVLFAGQGGLFDVLLDPSFTENQTLYLSFSQGNAESNGTEVVSARLEGDALVDVATLFKASPEKYAPLHFGGRLAFLNNSTLLVQTGDGFDFREKTQATGNHFGKTIRIALDGDKSGAPFPEAPLVYTVGHRNPQGLAVASDGTIYSHEHGPKGGDEVNIIEAGKNYGWPAITYGEDYNGAYVSPFTEAPGMEQPIHYWTPSIAPSGLMIYEGDMFQEWQGDLFVGALVDSEVRRLEMADRTVVAETTEFPEIKDRIRDIRQAPDGSIYVVTDGPQGKVYRISR